MIKLYSFNTHHGNIII